MTELAEFADDPPARDFRRSNGAPMVTRPDDSGKWDRYSRPSGWGKDLDDENALVLWKIDRAIDGMATRPDLVAKAASMLGLKEGRKELREQAINAGRGDEAADIGTALHAMAHRIERGDEFVAPEPFASDMAVYLAELDRSGLRTVHCEIALVADRWRAAGTADRIYEATRRIALPGGGFLERGHRIIGDLKTGQKFDYSVPGYCIQLAIYADGVPYDVEANVRLEPIAELRSDWGLLVHMPAGQARCELFWTDLTIGRMGAQIVRDVREWRTRKDFVAEFQYPAPTDEMAALDAAVLIEGEGLDPGAKTLDELEPATEWTTAMAAWCETRIAYIGTLTEPRAALIRLWPGTIPPLRHGGHTAAQVSQILDLLDRIEAAYSLPFPPGDPRPGWDQGLHHTEMDRSNAPRTKEPEP